MGAGTPTIVTTMYDIDTYLEFTGRKLTRDPFTAALKLCAKGRKVLEEIPEPEPATPEWHELYEVY